MALAVNQQQLIAKDPTPDETFTAEMQAQQLLEVWGAEPGASEQRLCVLMREKFGVYVTPRDIRRIKRSQEFAELRILATDNALWGVTTQIMERMPVITEGIMDLAENARSERVRVDAFRELVGYLDRFAPRKRVDDNGLAGSARNTAVVNVLFGAKQDDVIEADVELLPPEDFDEGSEREKYFSMAEED